MRRTTFVINGQRFDSLDEIPPEYREFVEDQDGNGRPDWIDNALQGRKCIVVPTGSQNPFGAQSVAFPDLDQAVTTVETYVMEDEPSYQIGDRFYESIRDVPQEIRAAIERVQAHFPASTPVVDKPAMPPCEAQKPPVVVAPTGNRPVRPVSVPQEEDTSHKMMLAALALFGGGTMLGILLGYQWFH